MDAPSCPTEEGRVEFVVWSTTGGGIAAGAPPAAGHQEHLEREINAFVLQLSSGYIWQHGAWDEPPLYVPLNRRGSLVFGVNADDEWYVVYLLRRVTEAFEVAVQIWDEDGEFLLIEAAYSLPSWLEPASAPNRVWIFRGAVHCLPRAAQDDGGDDETSSPSPSPFSATGTIDVSTPEKALESLLRYAERAKACGEGIEGCISRKLVGYPALAKETMMQATACLPHQVALCLAMNPQRVSVLAAAYSASLAKDRKKAATELGALPGMAEAAREEDRRDDGKVDHEQKVQDKHPLVPMVVTFNRWLYAEVVQSHDDTAIEGLMRGCAVYRAYVHCRGRTVGDPDPDQNIRERQLDAAMLGFKLSLGGLLLPDGHTDDVVRLKPDTSTVDIPTSYSFTRDDDSWLHEPSARLNEELDERERELDHASASGFNPDELVGRMRQFVETMSNVEGAVVEDEEVKFDPEVFLSILRGEGMGGGACDDDDDDDEGSSFYDMSGDDDDDDDDDDDEDDDEGDDEGDDDVDGGDGAEEYHAYGAAMTAQLEEELCGARDTRNPTDQTTDRDRINRPLDVDISLVENLLASVELGQTGPMGGLSGLLGVKLPKTS